MVTKSKTMNTKKFIKPKIVICHPNIVLNSIVCNDIIGMYELLSSMGLSVRIASEKIDKVIALNYNCVDFCELLNFDYDILIYHFSYPWNHSSKLMNFFKGNLIVKYHELALHEAPSNKSITQEEAETIGQNFAKWILNKHPKTIWLTNSVYHKNKLMKLGISSSNINVLPFFNNIQLKSKLNVHTKQPAPIYKLLMVGDFVPGAGHIDFIKVIKTYIDTFSNRIEIIIAGDYNSDYEYYLNEIIHFIMKFKLEYKLELIVNATNEQLDELFLSANLFVTFSELENNFEYILKAQASGIPVIASNSPFIEELLGELYIPAISEKRFDHLYYAQLIKEVLTDSYLYESCVNVGYKNMTTKFSNHLIDPIFIKSVYPLFEKYK